jgi:hypothetical protein
MSIPIKYCFLVEAADNTDSFRKLHPTMYDNIKGGHFTVLPCNHDPPCRQLTAVEETQLFDRFRQKPPA